MTEERIIKWVIFGFLSQANRHYMRLPAHIIFSKTDDADKWSSKTLCGRIISNNLYVFEKFKNKCKKCVKKESQLDGKEIFTDHSNLQVKLRY